jgi:hypothetical protein
MPEVRLPRKRLEEEFRGDDAADQQHKQQSGDKETTDEP